MPFEATLIQPPNPPPRTAPFFRRPLNIKKPRRGRAQERNKKKRHVYFGSVSSGGGGDAEWVSFSQTTKTTVTISKASSPKKPAADA